MPLRLGDVGARGRAPTRGAHTVGLGAHTGEGTHKGCPYGWMTWARGGGHPQGVPLRLVTWARGGGHPRGVPLRVRMTRAHGGEGTHKTYGWVLSARTGGRAPTRGAYTVGY